MGFHDTASGSVDMHGPYSVLFADDAARTGDTGPYTAAQSIAGGSSNPIKALQIDTLAEYILADHDPIDWDAAAVAPSAHTMGGASHTADTLANLNTKISDANVDDDGDPRPPTAHTHSHASTTGQGTDDHHAQAHTVASHSDTTATGAELETLTDGSNADALHDHADMPIGLNAESLGSDTTSGTTPVTKTSLVIPDETGTWEVQGHAALSHSNSTGNANLWLENTTDSLELGRRFAFEPEDAANDIYSPMIHRRFSNTSGNGAKTIALRYAVDPASGTMTISDAYMTARKVA